MIITSKEARNIAKSYGLGGGSYLEKLCNRIKVAAVDGRFSLEMDFVYADAITELRQLGFVVTVDNQGVVISW